MNDVGAVVVTHNNAATIGTCLTSLTSAGVKDVVVIDNASSDDTVKQIINYPVTVIKNETNQGFGQAANRAATLLRTPYLLLLNPDARLEGGLTAAVDQFQNHPNLGIIGLSLHTLEGDIEPHSFGTEPSLTHLLTRKFTSSLPSPEWVSGAAMLIRQTTWQALNGFDPTFFMYWEDVDLCRRAREKGWEVAVTSTARVMHQRGGSHNTTSQKTAFYDASADRYYRKHYPIYIWGIQHYLRRIYRYFYPQAL